MIKALLVFQTILFFSLSLIAQENKEKRFSEKGSIESQFDFMIEKSNNFQDYKVIRLAWLKKLKENVSDSLIVIKQELLAKELVIATQKKEIEALNSNLIRTNDNLTDLKTEKNNISFLGFQVSKKAYKSIMWATLFVLSGTLTAFVLLFKGRKTITANAQAELTKIKEEFELYKKRSLEKEQKLSRELQNELNKRIV